MLLLDIPNEVLISIISYTELDDVISLRKTCRRLFHLSRERSIWEGLYLAQISVYPTPCAHDGLPQLSSAFGADLEVSVCSVHVAARLWLSTRTSAQTLVKGASPNHCPLSSTVNMAPIQDMHVLLHRWLIVVYQEGLYELWNLFSSNEGTSVSGFPQVYSWNNDLPKPVCIFQADMQGGCISSSACVDHEDDTIILVVVKQSLTSILKIDVNARSPIAQTLAIVVTSPFPMHIIKAVDPRSRVIVFSFALTLHFVHWPTLSYWAVMLNEDEDELYNMILSAHFLTPRHLICLKSRSVELLTLDFLGEICNIAAIGSSHAVLGTPLFSRGQRHPHQMQQPLPHKSINLRGAVFSHPNIIRLSDDGFSVEITFLAYDVLRGLFHHSVHMEFACDGNPYTDATVSMVDAPSPVPRPLNLTVSLKGAHHMAQLGSLADVIPGPHSLTRSRFTSGSRGFISACALGEQGKRGVWVERQRINMGRSIHGFSTNNYLRKDNLGNGEGSLTDGNIQGQRIFEVLNSYDLRDDITHCVLSEVSGRVVLGTRRGQLLIL